MKYYLACKFNCKDQINKVAEKLEEHGHEITCKWWNIEQKKATERTFEESREVGQIEIDSILNCDYLVCFLTDSTYPYKGTLCEIGIAIGAGVKVIIVIPPAANSTTHSVLQVPHLYTQNFVVLESEVWEDNVHLFS